MQNHDAKDAYQRWDSRLEDFIDEMRESYSKQKPFPEWIHFKESSEVGSTGRWRVLRQGRIVWGVFARAFWPIYTRGENNHYGTVLCGLQPPALDRGVFLFELGQTLRNLRENGGEKPEHREFFQAVRDDFDSTSRLMVPGDLAASREIYFQAIYIHREKLPAGYLHHRLVPIIIHETIPYASILPLRFWGDEFSDIWKSGSPPLSEATLQQYQLANPGVIP